MIKLIYENIYGTTITPVEEFSYIVICLGETFRIVGSHMIKKFAHKKS